MNIQYTRSNNAIPTIEQERELTSFLKYVARICVERIVDIITQVASSEIPRQICFMMLGYSGFIGKMVANQLINRTDVQVSVPNFIGNRIYT